MKILYGITKSNFGGAQRYVFELAVEAKKRGHDVAALCGQRGPLVHKLEKENIRVIALETLERDISIIKEIKSFLKIVEILKEENPDALHINSSKMGGLGAFAGRVAGIKKIIFTSHGWAFNEPRPLWQKPVIRFFVWLTIMFSHKTVCVSERSMSQVSRWPFTKKKLLVIRNGVTSFDLVERQEAPFTVGTIAELHKIKGLDILLRAWSKFVNRREARLVIMGEGEEKDNLNKLAEELGISNSVEFRGYVENARSHLLEFDILVMPSRSEGLPYSLLEAGLTARPVIAANVGGIPEVIESGISGALVPAEDSEAIFSSLILLSEDENLRERLGSALKASVKENFSFEKMAGQTFDLY